DYEERDATESGNYEIRLAAGVMSGGGRSNRLGDVAGSRRACENERHDCGHQGRQSANHVETSRVSGACPRSRGVGRLQSTQTLQRASSTSPHPRSERKKRFALTSRDDRSKHTGNAVTQRSGATASVNPQPISAGTRHVRDAAATRSHEPTPSCGEAERHPEATSSRGDAILRRSRTSS